MSERYHRQTILPEIGQAGQAKLADATAVVLGVGALGTVSADALARAGIGRLILVDRDVVERTNLQRQTLYAEADVGQPKAVAAASRLQAVNSDITLDPRPIDVSADNIEVLVKEASFVLDGLDNAQTRYLLNDACVKIGVPWFYGAAVGTEGRTMAVVPQETACLRCVFPEPPAAGELDTCDTRGILAMTAGIVGNRQAAAAVRFVVSGRLVSGLTAFDVWNDTHRHISVTRTADCPCCGQREYVFLDQMREQMVSLCGRDAVQVRVGRCLDLDQLRKRWSTADVRHASTPFMVKIRADDVTLSAFADGRVLVQGTQEASVARSLVNRYVGT
jgi:adenylyltransferase/sulfurtransferase